MQAYARPEDLGEALTLLAQAPRTVLAGGTDLFAATQKQRLDGPVLDLTRIAALRGIIHTAEGLRIGACTPWADVARHSGPPACEALAQAAAEVGGRQIQAAGTVGGNLCNASPAADGVPPLLVLEAEVELAMAGGTRRMPLAAFLTGPRRTALAQGEIVVAVHLPTAALSGRSRFLKLGARRHLVISIAMVAARLVVTDGRVAAAALAVGACGPVACRLPEVESALDGTPVAEAAERIDPAAVAAALSPIDDVRADAGYRAEAAADLLRRAVADLAA